MSRLRAALLEHGARFSAAGGVERAASFGDSGAEYGALRATVGLLDQSFRDRVRVAGRDRIEFLNGMVTNDVARLKAGQGVYTAAVNVKGKMLADGRIYCLADSLLLDLEPGVAATLVPHLDRYIIAADVVLQVVNATTAMLSLYGPRAAAVVDALLGPPPPTEQEFARVPFGTDAVLVSRNDVTGGPGYDLIVSSDDADELWRRLLDAGRSHGIRPVGHDALEVARIEAGIPRFGVDLDEHYFPMEARLENRAISFTKGCYLGQEVIARGSTLGRMNRLLVGLELDGAAVPPHGAEIVQDGVRLGVVTGACFSPARAKVIALGYVRTEASRAGTVIAVATANGSISGVVRDLPFFTIPGGSVAVPAEARA